MGKRWRGKGEGGAHVYDLLLSYCSHDGYFLVTRYFLTIPASHRRHTHSDSLLSIWAADFQRGCSGLFESHLLGSEPLLGSYFAA